MFELRNLGLVEVRHHVTEVAVLGILDELVETVDEAAVHVVPGALHAAELPEVVGDILNEDADYEHHEQRRHLEVEPALLEEKAGHLDNLAAGQRQQDQHQQRDDGAAQVRDLARDDARGEEHDERGEAELCAVGTALLGGNHDRLYLFSCSSDLVR